MKIGEIWIAKSQEDGWQKIKLKHYSAEEDAYTVQILDEFGGIGFLGRKKILRDFENENRRNLAK